MGATSDSPGANTGNGRGSQERPGEGSPCARPAWGAGLGAPDPRAPLSPGLPVLRPGLLCPGAGRLLEAPQPHPGECPPPARAEAMAAPSPSLGEMGRRVGTNEGPFSAWGSGGATAPRRRAGRYRPQTPLPPATRAPHSCPLLAQEAGSQELGKVRGGCPPQGWMWGSQFPEDALRGLHPDGALGAVPGPRGGGWAGCAGLAHGPHGRPAWRRAR